MFPSQFQVIIPCAAQEAADQATEEQLRLSWARVDGGHMPAGYRIENSKLILPRLERNFSGKYQCIVEDLSGRGFASLIDLKVGGIFHQLPISFPDSQL